MDSSDPYFHCILQIAHRLWEYLPVDGAHESVTQVFSDYLLRKGQYLLARTLVSMVRVLAQLQKGAGRAPHFSNLIVKEHIC